MSVTSARIGPYLRAVDKQNIPGNQIQLQAHPHALLENLLERLLTVTPEFRDGLVVRL
jgi:hypothetical protein